MSNFLLTRRSALIATGATALVAGAPLGALAESKPFAVGDQAIGDENAPVTMIEYASLTCPHCATFHEDTWPSIKAEYVDTGKVRFIMREVYFDRFGLWAGMVARCGGADKYYPFIDIFMKSQRRWTSGSEAEVVENIRRVGKQGGLTDADLDACLNDEDFARGLVEDYQTNAERDSVRSTPTVFVNGDRLEGNQPFEVYAEAIDKHL